MLKGAPILAIAVLIGPIVAGLLATLLPSLGYWPALGGNNLSFEPIADLLAMPGIWQSVALSFGTGLATTAIALGLVAAFTCGWHDTPIFARLQHIISPLLSVPHAAAAFGLAFLIAPSGIILRLLSPWATGSDRPPDLLILNDPMGLALVAGLIAKEIPFLLLVTLSALPQTPAQRATTVAQSLGYGRTMGFWLTTWPLIYRQIRLAVFAVLAYATSVVDVAIILGPTSPPTLAVRLTQWMSDPDLSLRFVASAGALLQLAVTVAAIATWIVGEKVLAALRTSMIRSGRRASGDVLVRSLALSGVTLSALVVFFGLIMLGLWSVAGFWPFPDAWPRGLNLDRWTRTLPSLSSPLQNTLIAGVAATLIAGILAIACLEREHRTGRDGGSRALLLIYLPLIVPQVSFVFGLQIFFLSLRLDATWFALIFAHLIFVLPYVFLSLSDPWRAWDKRYAQIGHGLGASDDRIFWRIRFPMMIKPILVATSVGFAVSVGQYLPTLLIGAGRLPSITTEAVALASGGDRRVIGVYAFVQLLLPFIAFALATAIPAFLFRKRRDMRSA